MLKFWTGEWSERVYLSQCIGHCRSVSKMNLHCTLKENNVCAAGPGGPGRWGCVSSASDQQDESSQSGASFRFGGALPCRNAKGEWEKAEWSFWGLSITSPQRLHRGENRKSSCWNVIQGMWTTTNVLCHSFLFSFEVFGHLWPHYITTNYQRKAAQKTILGKKIKKIKR